MRCTAYLSYDSGCLDYFQKLCTIFMNFYISGWHPGIPEGAAIWDEEWDKFEDEGTSGAL